MFSVLSPEASAVSPPGGVARGKPEGWAGPPGREPPLRGELWLSLGVAGKEPVRGKFGVSLGMPGKDESPRGKPEVADGKETSPLGKPAGSAVLAGKDAPGELGVSVLLENRSPPPETCGGSAGRAGNDPPRRGKPVFSSGAAGAVGKEPSLCVAPGDSVRTARKESVISQGGTLIAGLVPDSPAPGDAALDGPAPNGPAPGDAAPAAPKPPSLVPEGRVPAASALPGVPPAGPVPDRAGPVPDRAGPVLGWAPAAG